MSTPPHPLKERLALALVPRLYLGLSRLWFSTCRLETHGLEHRLAALADGGPAIACFWHYGVFYIFHFLRRDRATAMVSASRDGEYIARVAQLSGLNTVRGSSHRQGVQALKGLIRAMRQGDNAALVGDGSQGPARRLQPGVLLLASLSGRPVLPIAWSASDILTFRSWDRTALPKPCCKVAAWYGQPVYVPPKLSDSALEEHRLLLESRMNDLYHQAWSRFGREDHDGLGRLERGVPPHA
ncbi:MAG: hypothetical protein BWK76_05475 [Desulfobulbaceae bacterium A2]|nr:MAG: hypothetical protein BWK76_05475 [Desulfobulbaceae bacterium A2]